MHVCVVFCLCKVGVVLSLFDFVVVYVCRCLFLLDFNMSLCIFVVV